MAGRNIAVFGIYSSTLDAERGAADLISAGYSSHDISVLLADGRRPGATAGGLLGGALGILAGAGALVIPGAGPFVAAGPLVARLAGLGIGGPVGGLMDALVGMGIPEYEARCYEGRVGDGGALLSVHCESPARVKRAKQVLYSSGADDVAACNESRSASVELAVI